MKLKPCPFCGRESARIAYKTVDRTDSNGKLGTRSERYKIYCSSCPGQTMYDKLAKRLRCLKYGNCPDCPMWYSEEVEPNLWRERCAAIDAADAIEELSAYVRQIEELRKDGYYLQKTKMMTYGQATMTMPLPEPPKEEGTE